MCPPNKGILIDFALALFIFKHVNVKSLCQFPNTAYIHVSQMHKASDDSKS